MNQNEKSTLLQEAVQTRNAQRAGAIIVEVVLDSDEDTAEIAADFIENEIGRFDWVRNWEVTRQKGDPAIKVQNYLDTYGLAANANEIVNIIDQMAETNPGVWK